MLELGINVLRFTDNQVLKDTENVLRAIEFYIEEFEKHTPNPSQEGNFIYFSLNKFNFCNQLVLRSKKNISNNNNTKAMPINH